MSRRSRRSYANGRRGIGTVNHCAHGKNVSIEEVLDWVRPEYVTKRVNMQAPGVPRLIVTMELMARGPALTDVAFRLKRPRSAQDRRVMEAMWDQIRPGVEQDGATLIELAAADAAARAADRATEPDVPANTARHLSKPLTAAGGPIDYLPDDGSGATTQEE